MLSSSALPTPVQGFATGAREALHPPLCAPHRTVCLGLARRSNDPFSQNSNPLCPGCFSRLSQRRCCTTVQPMARASSPLVKLGQHSTETGQLWSQSLLFAMCVPLAPSLSILLDRIPSPLPPVSFSASSSCPILTVSFVSPQLALHASCRAQPDRCLSGSLATSHHPQPPLSIYPNLETGGRLHRACEQRALLT